MVSFTSSFIISNFDSIQSSLTVLLHLSSLTWSATGRFFLTNFPVRVCPIFQILTSSEEGDEKAITAMGVLNTLETILTVMESNEEVHSQLEPVILQVQISTPAG